MVVKLLGAQPKPERQSPVGTCSDPNYIAQSGVGFRMVAPVYLEYDDVLASPG
jgi:hypothetical protein